MPAPSGRCWVSSSSFRGGATRFAVASQALLDAHRDGLAYCIEQIFARLKKVPPGSPAVPAVAFMGLSQGLSLQQSILSEVPIGHMIMVFLRSLLATAEPVR